MPPEYPPDRGGSGKTDTSCTCHTHEASPDLSSVFEGFDDATVDPVRGSAANAQPQSQANARLDIDPDDVRRGLGQLVLTIARLVHELLEKQAIRRIDAGSLTDEEAERIGTTLMLQAREIRTLAGHFGVDPDDLNLDLGPLGKLL